MNRLGKRARTTSEKSVLWLYQREVGELSPRAFSHTAGASENLVLQLDLYKKLEKHRGCVNTVSFNALGDILVSGSDDRVVKLWDWEVGRVKLSFHSGHANNVFQAKFMPFTDDRSIVTCAADGQVRHAKILEHGKVETVMLGKHQGRAHKLAIEPGSPHIFYTCGEDGLVQHFDLRTGTATELFTCKSFHEKSRFDGIVCLNTIAMDPRNANFFAVGGSDEYARIYDIRKYKWNGSTDFGQPADSFCPQHLIGSNKEVGITGLSFSYQSELLVSYNDEQIYLFTMDMGLGPNPIASLSSSGDGEATGTESDPVSMASPSTQSSHKKISKPQEYSGHMNCKTVKGVGFFGPNCEYVVSGSDCGRIFIWRKKGGQLLRAMEGDRDVVNCIVPHPHAPFLASSGIDKDVKIWIPKASERSSLPVNLEQLKRPRRRLLYRISSPQELMFQILSLQRQRSSPDSIEEDSPPSRELLELVMSFNGNRDGSSDDDGDAGDSSNNTGSGDCIVN